MPELTNELKNTYLHSFDEASLENVIQVLEGRFVSKEAEYQKYKKIDIIGDHDAKFIRRMVSYAKRLQIVLLYFMKSIPEEMSVCRR